MDFSNYLFRCSSLGKLMTGVKPNLTDRQLAEMERLLALQSQGKITEKQTITLGDLLQKKHEKKELSETTKSELKKIHRQALTKRETTVKTKYMEKGIQVEEQSFTLYYDVTKKRILKNKERKFNEFITGECDVIFPSEIIEFKNSWELETFPLYETEIPNSDYDYQLNGYLDLYDREESILTYTLVDTPIKLINDELRRIDFKHNIFNNEGDVRQEARSLVVEEISRKIYTLKGLEEYCQQSTNVYIDWFEDFIEIPKPLRVKEFYVRRDRNKMETVYGQVIKWREYLNELSLQISEKLN